MSGRETKGARVGQTFDSPLKERRIGFVAVVGPHRKGDGKIHLMELVFYSELAVSKSAEKKVSPSLFNACALPIRIYGIFLSVKWISGKVIFLGQFEKREPSDGSSVESLSCDR